ncbi:DNA polymerase Y family protein [Acuticoccus sp. I52.16.1]|uniref:Y-family DNA polymerase n=1 Tax=Acuticoccus sp. I52.16.1 TaxID=2928472 RepID=UPI001FD4B45B|nr:DNA polymerase Y family protein [Acuticoccus sp. I52.16.1]UOM35528.1 DNA polymerase Y family protein [Acuticoccus sp. I52.16.1]
MQPTRRILYVWLAYLPTDRLMIEQRFSPDAPVVTYAKQKGAMLLEAVDRSAQAAKLRAGMALAEARALAPHVEVHLSDPHADMRLLERIARDLERFTPLVGLDQPDGLMLDIAGCAHLFGGEEALVEALRARCVACGVQVQVAVADTPAVAWALARHGHGHIVPEGETLSAVCDLPTASMRLPDETAAVLQRLGLKTVAQVLAQSRKSLTQRFGPLIGRRIDQMSGLEDEPITPLTPASPHIFDRAFAEPVSHIEALEAGLRQLAASLTGALAPRGLGTRLLQLRLFQADGMVRDIAVGASAPLNDAARITRLVAPRLQEMSARIESDSGVDLMRIYAGELERIGTSQPRLDETEDVSRDFEALVDTLSERFGASAVYHLAPVNTHDPSSQTQRVPARQALRAPSWGEAHRPRWRHGPLRPLRLLEPPEPILAVAGVPDGAPVRFLWRRVFYHVAIAEGPERIAPEWWREEAGHTCDYFRVEDREGRRFWLFRKGLFAGESQPPKWFLHGFFG